MDAVKRRVVMVEVGTQPLCRFVSVNRGTVVATEPPGKLRLIGAGFFKMEIKVLSIGDN